MKKIVTLLFLVLLVAISSADTIVIGNSLGEVFARDEFNLGASSGYITYGPTFAITSMAAGVDGDVAIGTKFGQPDVRKANNLAGSGVPTTKFTYAADSAISSIATRPNGDVVMGTQDNQVFVRDRTNLTAYPAGFTPPDGWTLNGDITAIATLSNGNLVIGDSAGYVYLQSGTNLFGASPYSPWYVNFGMPVTALAVTPNDDIVMGFSSGYVDVRSPSNIYASLTNVNFGISIGALATLSDGTVAIGLGNGYVDVRNATNLTGAVITSAYFTGGAGITAMTATSGDNLAIGTADNLMFVRQGDNLGLKPVGFVGVDGLNFNAPIGGLAAVVPEPATLALLGLGILALNRKRK